MLNFIIGRAAQSVLCLLIVSFVVFYAARLSGDPTVLMLSEMASNEDAARLRAHLGLDKSMPEQFWRFLSQAALGDFGESTRYRRPVIDVLASGFPASLHLGSVAFIISLLVALPIGVYAALNRSTALAFPRR